MTKTLYTIDWLKHFVDDSQIAPSTLGVEREVVKSETPTSDGLGMKFHHWVFLDKLVTTDEEAELYFRQLVLYFGDHIRHTTESFYYNSWSFDQNGADKLALELETLTVINNLMSPANTQIGPKGDFSQELSPWLKKYKALLFSNAFVRAARHAGLPASARFWSAAED